MVRLVAVDTNNQRGDGPAIAAWLDPHPVPAHARRTASDIKSAIRAERDGWELAAAGLGLAVRIP